MATPHDPNTPPRRTPKSEPPPAKYQPTVHDADDPRIHGRMKGDEQDPRLRCPKDSMYMEKVAAAGMEIDRCAGCGAMWFDALELDKVLESGQARNYVKQLDIGATGRHTGVRALGALVCPRCRSPLIRLVDIKQEHVEEMACTVCGGILLDAGELKDLSEFTLGEKVRHMLSRLKGG